MQRFYAPIRSVSYEDVGYLRRSCDGYYCSSSGYYGGACTVSDTENMEFLKERADRRLDRFNEKNFVAVEILKLNMVGDYRMSYLTFRARDSETGETCCFRGVVGLSDQVVLCEIRSPWLSPFPFHISDLNNVCPMKGPAWDDGKLFIFGRVPSNDRSMETYHRPIVTEEYIPVGSLQDRYDDNYVSRGIGGEPRTCVDSKRLLLLKHEAQLCLDRFNEKNGKKFVVVEMVKLNEDDHDNLCISYLTFRARDSETGETCEFRGVIEPSSDQVLLCEITWPYPLPLPFRHLEHLLNTTACSIKVVPARDKEDDDDRKLFSFCWAPNSSKEAACDDDDDDMEWELTHA